MRALVLLVVLLPSCSLVNAIKDTAVKTRELAGQVGELAGKATATLARAEETYASAAKEADTDGDGKTSSAEWLAYLASLIGVGTGAVAEGRRRVGVRNAQSDARKDALEEKVAKLERRP